VIAMIKKNGLCYFNNGKEDGFFGKPPMKVAKMTTELQARQQASTVVSNQQPRHRGGYI
jgi:hypothetical protein